MALFSQRKGIKPLFKQPQIDGLDQETRNQLWTALKLYALDAWSGDYYDSKSEEVELLYKRIWINLFKLPLDSVPSFDPSHPKGAYRVLRTLTLEDEWHHVFD